LGIRLVLSNRQWERIAPHSIGGERTRGSSGRDNRLFVEAVLWLVRTGGAVARFSRGLRPLEQRVPAVQPVEPEGRLVADPRGAV
jgi:transposase